MAIEIKTLVPQWIRALAPYPPGKPIEELEREYGVYGSIKLASNENPLGPSPKAVAAIAAALGELHRYPDGNCFYLKEATARKYRVSPDNLIFGTGSNEIIELAVRTFLQPKEEAVMSEHAFVVYKLIVQAAGGVSREVPMRNLTHDLGAMTDAITARTRIVFLANPNNPTGTIFRKREWEEFVHHLPAGVIVVVDEAYFEYVEDPDYPDSLAWHGKDRLLITLRTFSKVYGLAGIRLGFGIASPELIEVMNRVRQPFNVSSLAQVAALAALDDEEHLRRTLQCNREGMSYLRAELQRLGVEAVPSAANFLLVRVGGGARIYEALLRLGVIVRPMGVYDLSEYVRVTVGTASENERFIRALEQVRRAGGVSASAF